MEVSWIFSCGKIRNWKGDLFCCLWQVYCCHPFCYSVSVFYSFKATQHLLIFNPQKQVLLKTYILQRSNKFSQNYEDYSNKSLPGKWGFWVFSSHIIFCYFLWFWRKLSWILGESSSGWWELQMGGWQKCGNLWFHNCCYSYGSSKRNCGVIIRVPGYSHQFLFLFIFSFGFCFRPLLPSAKGPLRH